MQYRPLGRTGVRVSILGLGGESALYRRSDEAVRIIKRAIQLGVNYFDTAPLYQDSELNFGDALSGSKARQNVFLATKTDRRDYTGAWRQFEASLRRLRVDRVDLLQIHHLSFPDEAKFIFLPQGVVRMVTEAKNQGLTRFVGVTGHTDPDVLLYAIERYPFDTILMALNPAEVHVHSFQEKLLPKAVSLGMGIAAMKVMARGVLFPSIPSSRVLLSYVWSLPISTAVVGVMNEAQLVRNVESARRFFPLSRAALDRMEEMTQDSAQAVNFYRKGARGPFPTVETMPRMVL